MRLKFQLSFICRLIGIGLEKLGKEDFDQFFDGELFIDETLASYQALGFAKTLPGGAIEVRPVIPTS